MTSNVIEGHKRSLLCLKISAKKSILMSMTSKVTKDHMSFREFKKILPNTFIVYKKNFDRILCVM